MTIKYSYIIRQAGIRIGAYKGLSATINTNYPTVSNISSASFPLPALKDSLRATEEEMCIAVASNREHIWWGNIGDVTISLASGDTIPATGASGSTKKIIGVYGKVKDASNNKLLTPGLHEDEIRALRDNPNSIWKLDYYSYAIAVPCIYHTRTGVKIDVCVYDATTQEAAIDADSELLFPEAEGAYLSGLMSKLKNEDERYMKLAEEYEGEYAQWITAFQQGRTYIGPQPAAPA